MEAFEAGMEDEVIGADFPRCGALDSGVDDDIGFTGALSPRGRDPFAAVLASPRPLPFPLARSAFFS